MSALAQGKFNQQEGCDPKKAALKVNFYVFLLLLYLFPNVFLARVIEVIATVPKETKQNKKEIKKKRAWHQWFIY